MINPSILRAYDVRGVYPTEINKEAVDRIARAFVAVTGAKKIAVGRDVRTSGHELQQQFMDSAMACGVGVVDIGIVSTDMLYFAAGSYESLDGAVTISASHNPSEFNGIKMVGRGAAPLDPDGNFAKLKDLALNGPLPEDVTKPGSLEQRDLMDSYLDKVLSFVKLDQLKPLKIVANPNFGAACLSLKKLHNRVPFELIGLNDQVDGSFPKGRPDPLRPETRAETVALIKQTQPAFGVAWDADADRVFFYTEQGEFVSSYYIGALLTDYFVTQGPHTAIVHETVNWWAIDDLVKQHGGVSARSKAGHVFFKKALRDNNAVYGSEFSAHHYFRDYYSCDNGLIPFLLVWQMVSQSGSLEALVQPLRQRYPVSDEINFEVRDRRASIEAIKTRLSQFVLDEFDGLTLGEGRDWAASIRCSNNEPLLRLNIQAATPELVRSKTEELSNLIKEIG